MRNFVPEHSTSVRESVRNRRGGLMALTECNAPDKSLTVNSLQGKEWNSSFMCINVVGLHFRHPCIGIIR